MHDQLPVYSMRADSGELGPDGFLKLQGYHEILCRIFEHDMESGGHPLSSTLSAGYAWAMLSLSMQVNQPIRSCENLQCQTWVSSYEYPYLRREIQVFFADGAPAFSAALFLAPLSTASHGLYPEEYLQDISFDILPQHTVEWAQSRMKHITPEQFTRIDTRTVRPSDIDALGHLNNCRYGAYVYDAMISLGADYTSAPFRYTTHFMRQCTAGEQIYIGTCASAGSLAVLGTGKNDGKKRFCSKISLG